MFTNPLLRENEELKKRLAITLERTSDLERALELAKPCAAPVSPPLGVPEAVETPLGSFSGTDTFTGTTDAKVTRDNQPIHGLEMA